MAAFNEDDLDEDVFLAGEGDDDEVERNPQPNPDDDDEIVTTQQQQRPAEADDDDEDFSQRVRKRIGKEVGKRKHAEERAARLESDLAALRAEVDAVKLRHLQDDAKADDASFQQRLADTRAKMKRALEDGDEDAQVEFAEELADLRVEKRAREIAQQQSQQPQQPRLPRGTSQWLESNSWYQSGNPEYRRAAILAAEIDAELQREGYSPEDPRMYAELNARLVEDMPKMAKVLNGGQQRGTRSGGPPVGASTPDGVARSPTGRRRQFTAKDRAEMQAFNLQDTPENRKIWLETHPTQD